jgi:hypothetical protein
MGSGVAKRIKDEYPIVYDNYMEKYNAVDRRELLLGDIQIVPLYDDYYATNYHPCVVNFFSQLNYGYDGARYTSYDAFWNCLNLLKLTVPKGATVAFPARIGCGLGGANWTVISQMINEVLGLDYNIYIVDYEGDAKNGSEK